MANNSLPHPDYEQYRGFQVFFFDQQMIGLIGSNRQDAEFYPVYSPSGKIYTRRVQQTARVAHELLCAKGQG